MTVSMVSKHIVDVRLSYPVNVIRKPLFICILSSCQIYKQFFSWNMSFISLIISSNHDYYLNSDLMPNLEAINAFDTTPDNTVHIICLSREVLMGNYADGIQQNC